MNWIDLLIFAAYFILMLVIGFYFANKHTGTITISLIISKAALPFGLDANILA